MIIGVRGAGHRCFSIRRLLLLILYTGLGIYSVYYSKMEAEIQYLLQMSLLKIHTPLLIPKIIHQTYKNEDLPEHWKNAQNAVKYYHPDYEYMVHLS